jgi:hypothetical protein
MVLEFEVSLSVVGGNNTTWGFGWNSDVDPTNQDTESIRITKQSADTNWQFYTATGGGHTIIDTGITPVVDTFDRIKLEFHGKNTAVGVASVEGVGINTFKTRCFINEKHVATIGTNSPIAQTNLTFAGYCTGVSTCVASIGPLLVTWNRYLSLPSL